MFLEVKYFGLLSLPSKCGNGSNKTNQTTGSNTNQNPRRKLGEIYRWDYDEADGTKNSNYC